MAVSPGIFRQYDIRGIVGQDLTVEAAAAIYFDCLDALRAQRVKRLAAARA